MLCGHWLQKQTIIKTAAKKPQHPSPYSVPSPNRSRKRPKQSNIHTKVLGNVFIQAAALTTLFKTCLAGEVQRVPKSWHERKFTRIYPLHILEYENVTLVSRSPVSWRHLKLDFKFLLLLGTSHIRHLPGEETQKEATPRGQPMGFLYFAFSTFFILLSPPG
jgi:hypothetical protein